MSKQMVPEIRFEGFEDEWQESRLNDVVNKITRKNESLTTRNPLTISAQDGLISQLKYYDWQVASKNLTNYYLLFNGDFAYNKSYSNGYPVGAVKRLENYDKGVLSTLYIVFRPEEIGSNFLKHYYESTYWYRSIYEIADEGARNHGLLNVKPIEFFNTKIKYPIDKTEQKKIGKQFEKIEKIITDKIVDLEKLKSFKQAMLQKMFPKEGEKEPEIRFEGFSGEWDSYELGSLVDISTGKLDANAMVENGKYDFYTSGIKKYKIDIPSFSGPAITIAGNGATVGYMHLADGEFNAYQRTYVLQNFTTSRKYLYLEVGRKLPIIIKKEARMGNIPYIVMDMLVDLKIELPDLDEQVAIGNFFMNLDNKIELEQQNLEKLKQFKKAMLEKMFV